MRIRRIKFPSLQNFLIEHKNNLFMLNKLFQYFIFFLKKIISIK